MATVVLDEILAQNHGELQGFRQLIGTRLPPRVEIDHAGDIQAFPVETVAVVFHHLLCCTLGSDGQPNGGAHQVHGNGNIFDDRAGFGQRSCSRPDFGVRCRHGVGPTKTFLDNTDAQAFDALLHDFRVVFGMLLGVLAGVQTIGAGNDFQHDRVVRDIACHGSGVVDGEFNRHDAGIGHQTVRGFHAVHAAVRRGHANGAALVATDGQVDFACCQQCRAARRRAARRVAVFVGVVHRAGGAGVRAARETEIFTHRLAHHGGTGVEQARDHSSVDIGHIALQGGSAIHHGNASHADVVFQYHGLASQFARRCTLDGGLHIPSPIFIVFRRGKGARGAWVLHFRHIVRQGIDDVIGVKVALQQSVVVFSLLFGEVNPQAVCDFLQLIEGRTFDSHAYLLLC